MKLSALSIIVRNQTFYEKLNLMPSPCTNAMSKTKQTFDKMFYFNQRDLNQSDDSKTELKSLTRREEKLDGLFK